MKPDARDTEPRVGHFQLQTSCEVTSATANIKFPEVYVANTDNVAVKAALASTMDMDSASTCATPACSSYLQPIYG